MLFSPAYISNLIVRPLRYFFENHAPEELRWDIDDKKSCIEIDTINNFNKVKIQAKPRILVSRGQYSVNPVGLTDNLASARSIYEMKGSTDKINMVTIQGVAQIMVEARNEGTCEKVLDVAQHFLAWTAPMIANAHGFKQFALPLNVSTCNPNKEDTEIFSCTINVPWFREEHWSVKSDDVSIKNFLLTLKPE